MFSGGPVRGSDRHHAWDVSAGGDSGSLIVGQNGNHPVGLLFAGSNTNTLANRIDLVLNRFAVNIDSDAGGPMLAIKDVTITEGNSGT